MGKGLFLLLAASVLVVILVLDSAFKQPVLDSNAELAIFLQKASTPAVDWLFKFIETISILLAFAIPFLSLAAKGLGTGLPLFTSLCTSSVITSMLKMTYAQQRPYWAYGAVQAISCSPGFGHPSGHALTTASVYGLTAYYAHKQEYKKLVCGLLVSILIVGLDRVYLGVHSYNQVILGWSIASVLIPTIIALKVSKESNLNQVFVGSHVFFFVCLAVAGLLFAYSDPYWDNSWSEYVFEKCGKRLNAQVVLETAILEMPLFAVFPGFLSGLVLRKRETTEKGDWGATFWKNAAVRFVFILAVFLCIMVVHYLVGQAENTAVTALVFGIAAYVGGVVIAYVTPTLEPFAEVKSDLNQLLVSA